MPTVAPRFGDILVPMNDRQPGDPFYPPVRSRALPRWLSRSGATFPGPSPRSVLKCAFIFLPISRAGSRRVALDFWCARTQGHPVGRIRLQKISIPALAARSRRLGTRRHAGSRSLPQASFDGLPKPLRNRCLLSKPSRLQVASGGLCRITTTIVRRRLRARYAERYRHLRTLPSSTLDSIASAFALSFTAGAVFFG